MTSPARIRQVRLDGPMPLTAIEAATQALAHHRRLYIDLRDANGDRIALVPARVVCVEASEHDPTEVLVVAIDREKEGEADPPFPRGGLTSPLAVSEPLSPVPSRRTKGREKPVKRAESPELVERNRAIVRERELGRPVREIASRYGVSVGNVYQIVSKARRT